MNGRASIFAPRDELDVGDFAPKTDNERRPDAEEIDKARSARFKSREPQPRTQQLDPPSTKRPPMVYRTGRNTTLSVKTTPEMVNTFYEIARTQSWKAGETFERAVEALSAALKGQGG